MDLKGTREIAADRATVWRALNDPEVLKACIPGCQEMTGSPEEGFEAVVKQKVGPVSATFKGAVTLSNVVSGESYTISGEGKGGAAGFAKGAADVRLEDAEGGGTLLSYDVQASVGGKLAQLGGRVIDPFARKMADQFFDNFRREVEGPGAAEQAAEPSPEPSPATPSGGPRPDPGAPSAGAAPRAAAPTAPRGGQVTPSGGASAGAVEAPGLWARVVAWFRGLRGRR
jgi:uncharacterized protein